MPRIAPDAIITQTNLNGAVTDIDDDPDSPDGSWLTASANQQNSILQVSFPTPANTLTTGAGLQEFRIQIRAANSGGSNVPWVMHLYEGGTDLGQIASGTMGGSETGAVVAGTWNASSLTAQSGANVEAYILFTGQGGSPANRNTGEVGAVEWNSTENTPPLEDSTTIDTAATISVDNDLVLDEDTSADTAATFQASTTHDQLAGSSENVVPTFQPTTTHDQLAGTSIDVAPAISTDGALAAFEESVTVDSALQTAISALLSLEEDLSLDAAQQLALASLGQFETGTTADSAITSAFSSDVDQRAVFINTSASDAGRKAHPWTSWSDTSITLAAISKQGLSGSTFWWKVRIADGTESAWFGSTTINAGGPQTYEDALTINLVPAMALSVQGDYEPALTAALTAALTGTVTHDALASISAAVVAALSPSSSFEFATDVAMDVAKAFSSDPVLDAQASATIDMVLSESTASQVDFEAAITAALTHAFTTSEVTQLVAALTADAALQSTYTNVGAFLASLAAQDVLPAISPATIAAVTAALAFDVAKTATTNYDTATEVTAAINMILDEATAAQGDFETSMAAQLIKTYTPSEVATLLGDFSADAALQTTYSNITTLLASLLAQDVLAAITLEQDSATELSVADLAAAFSVTTASQADFVGQVLVDVLGAVATAAQHDQLASVSLSTLLQEALTATITAEGVVSVNLAALFSSASELSSAIEEALTVDLVPAMTLTTLATLNPGISENFSPAEQLLAARISDVVSAMGFTVTETLIGGVTQEAAVAADTALGATTLSTLIAEEAFIAPMVKALATASQADLLGQLLADAGFGTAVNMQGTLFSGTTIASTLTYSANGLVLGVTLSLKSDRIINVSARSATLNLASQDRVINVPEQDRSED